MTFSLPRRSLIKTGLTLACLSALASCSTTQVLSPPAPPGPVMDFTDASLPLVNAARKAKGLPPLAIDPIAVAAARDQAMKMASAGKMAHKLGSEEFGARMRRMQVPLPAAENIASGQQTPEAAVAAWIKSPKHYENMMGPYQGLGVVRALNSADNRPYWAMVLSSKARPAPGMPAYLSLF